MSFEGIFIGSAKAEEGSPSPANAAQPNTFGMFLPLILVFGIFYLLILRPQAKQRKKHQEMVQKLKRGDEVVTTSGIHGKVFGIADNVATLELAENVRIKLDKSHVAVVKSVSAP